MYQNITLLGSTGSIGRQTLDVVRKLGIKVCALTANNSIKLLEEQAREFKPRAVCIADENKYLELKNNLADTDIKVLGGNDGILECARLSESDVVVNAIVGIAGLRPTLEAISAKKDIALANKETLVTGGELVKKAIRENGIKLLPVDSEHSAIFQCLQGTPNGSLKKIILTASGGPFFGKTRDELENVTVKDALNHPNWSMGAKITIDSATMMNKGLEVIEACHLFSVGLEQIEVVVHRESIIHSMIELNDNAVIAQLGTADMRIPIQYAITYPERFESPAASLDFTTLRSLTFAKPDRKVFECLALCEEAFRQGGIMPTIANGANEAAVALFLEGKIGFLDIPKLIKKAMINIPNKQNINIDDVFNADKMARELVLKG